MLQKKTSNALERLDQLEKTIPQIVAAVNQSVGQIQGQLSSAVEVLDAVVQTLGSDTIEKLILDSRKKKAEEQSDKEKQALAELVTQGAIVPANVVTEKSIIVGVETDKDGVVRVPGRAQVAFQRVDPQFQQGLLGQAVGFKLTLPNGGTFEVTELYEVAPPKASDAAEAAAPVADVPVVPAPTGESNS